MAKAYSQPALRYRDICSSVGESPHLIVAGGLEMAVDHAAVFIVNRLIGLDLIAGVGCDLHHVR